MAFSVCSKNGEIVPLSSATVSVRNIEYAYGFGVYETIRVVHGIPAFLEAHLARLGLSADAIGLRSPHTSAQIENWIKTLLLETKADTCNLKILLIGAREPSDVTLWILPLAPLFPDRKLYRDGATAITVSHERFLPKAKTLNMLPSYLFYRQAKERGCYDALLVDRHGNLTEGTRTNLLGIKGRTIVSPPRNDILEGVMRDNVLRVAIEQGYTVTEEAIPLASIDAFDGVFLTSTSTKILPLRQIDERSFTVPPALSELMKHVDRFLVEANGA